MKIDIFEKTRELGELIVSTDEYRAVQVADEIFQNDADTQEMIKDFNALQQTMQEIMQSPDPDQTAMSAMSSKLRQMQETLTHTPTVQAMNEAQTAFAGIMSQVNQVLRFVITGVAEENESGCGGNCSGCGGSCGHE